MSESHTIWRMTEADAVAGGALLGRAFADEPVLLAVIPDLNESRELGTLLFAASLRHAAKYGEAWAIGPSRDEMLGVAYTLLKPEPVMTDQEAITFGFAQLMVRWGTAIDMLDQMEHKAISELCDLGEGWRYLAGIGVEPGKQGLGIGSALMRHVIDRARAAGETFALSTDRPENVPFYERVGCTVVSEEPSLLPGTKFWGLVLRHD